MRLGPAVLAATFALCAVLRPAAAQRQPVAVITGTLLGADGAPMKLAHVEVIPAARYREISRTVVRPDGRFATATAERGAIYLRFRGVGHEATLVPLVIASPVAFAVDVRLKHLVYSDSLEHVAAVGDWNGFGATAPTPLARQADGRYTAVVQARADTVAYQLVGLQAGGGGRLPANGTEGEWYAPSPQGGYLSVVRTHAGRATIVLDPAQLDRRPSAFSLTFRGPASPISRQYALWAAWQAQRREYFDSSNAAYGRHDSLRYDWAPVVARRSAALARERDPLLRQMLLLQLLDAAQFGATVPRGIAQRIVREVPPSSPLWCDPDRTPWMIQQAFEIASGNRAEGLDSTAARASLAYLERVVAHNPDSNQQSMALFGALRIARSLSDQPRVSEYYARLVDGYPNAPITALARTRMAPRRLWRVGSEPPAFRFPALDDTTVSYTQASFPGRVVLFDFWATWCGPCVRDLPYLQAAYDSLAGRGLEILSVSFDDRPSDVRRFREGQWRMPWPQAYAPGGTGSAEFRELEVTFLPRMFLVGRDGKVLAVDEGLRAEELLPTLRRFLEAPSAP